MSKKLIFKNNLTRHIFIIFIFKRKKNLKIIPTTGFNGTWVFENRSQQSGIYRGIRLNGAQETKLLSGSESHITGYHGFSKSWWYLENIVLKEYLMKDIHGWSIELDFPWPSPSSSPSSSLDSIWALVCCIPSPPLLKMGRLQSACLKAHW